MPRPPRLDLPGARHYVMNRGTHHERIFLDDTDCVAFLSLLADLPRLYGVEVHGYALMPDHPHLLLACPHAGLGRAMQYLQSRFSAHINRRYTWDGPLFRGRYRNGMGEKALGVSPAGRRGGNPARDVAFWWLPHTMGVPRSAGAVVFKVDLAVATRGKQRAVWRAGQDSKVARWVEQLESLVPGWRNCR